MIRARCPSSMGTSKVLIQLQFFMLSTWMVNLNMFNITDELGG